MLDKLRNRIILFLVSLSVLMIPVAAATPQEQFINVFKIIFGLDPFTTDSLVMLRFALFLLTMIILGAITVKIDMFKQNPALGGLAAALISLISIRFTPDGVLYIFVMIIPILGSAAIIYFLWQMFKSFTGKTSKIRSIGLGAAVMVSGWLISRVIIDESLNLPTPPSAATIIGYMSWLGWFMMAGGLVIVVLALFDLVSGTNASFGIGRKLRKVTKSGEYALKGDKKVYADIKKEIALFKTEEKLSTKQDKLLKKIAKEINEAEKLLKKGKRKREKVKPILDKILQLINKEIAITKEKTEGLQDLVKLAKDAETRETSQLTKAQQNSIAGYITKLEAQILKRTAWEKKTEKQLLKYMTEIKAIIVKVINHAKDGQYANAEHELLKIEPIIKKIRQEGFTEHKIEENFEDLLDNVKTKMIRKMDEEQRELRNDLREKNLDYKDVRLLNEAMDILSAIVNDGELTARDSNLLSRLNRELIVIKKWMRKELHAKTESERLADIQRMNGLANRAIASLRTLSHSLTGDAKDKYYKKLGRVMTILHKVEVDENKVKKIVKHYTP